MSEAVSIPQLRFPEFSGKWEEKRLGDISKLTSSKRVYLDDYVKSGIPFYRGKEISELKKGLTPKDILYISNESYEQYKSKYGIPQVDDILITAVGTLGNILRIKDRTPFYFKDGNLIWIKDIYEYSNFLEILLEVKNKEIQKTSIGSTQRALTMVELRKLLLPFPTKPEQQKIAAFLTTVDNKIEQLSKKQALLGEYKKGLMQKIFSQAIRFKADDGSDFPEWEEKKLGDVLSSVSTRPYQIKSVDILEFGSHKVVDQGQKELAGYTNQEDKLLINDGVIVYGDHTTIAKFIDYDFVVGADGVKLLTSDSNNIKYLYFNLLFNNVEPEGYKRHFSILKNVVLQIPSLEEQTKIANFLSSIDNKIEQVGKQLRESKQFKKALLQQMFV